MVAPLLLWDLVEWMNDGPQQFGLGAHASICAAYSSGLKPTSKFSPPSSTGRLIIDGWASINAIALFSSSPAWSAGGSLRKVVPERLSNVSHPTCRDQSASRSRSMPDTL